MAESKRFITFNVLRAYCKDRTTSFCNTQLRPCAASHCPVWAKLNSAGRKKGMYHLGQMVNGKFYWWTGSKFIGIQRSQAARMPFSAGQDLAAELAMSNDLSNHYYLVPEGKRPTEDYRHPIERIHECTSDSAL